MLYIISTCQARNNLLLSASPKTQHKKKKNLWFFSSHDFLFLVESEIQCMSLSTHLQRKAITLYIFLLHFRKLLLHMIASMCLSFILLPHLEITAASLLALGDHAAIIRSGLVESSMAGCQFSLPKAQPKENGRENMEHSGGKNPWKAPSHLVRMK